MIAVKVEGVYFILTDIVGVRRDEKRIELYRAGVASPEIITYLDEETSVAMFNKISAALHDRDMVSV